MKVDRNMFDILTINLNKTEVEQIMNRVINVGLGIKYIMKTTALQAFFLDKG